MILCGDRCEYICSLTEELDNHSNISQVKDGEFCHYLNIYDGYMETQWIPIKTAGRTIGIIWIDENMKISKIFIDLIHPLDYSDDIDKFMQKYIGEEIKVNDI